MAKSKKTPATETPIITVSLNIPVTKSGLMVKDTSAKSAYYFQRQELEPGVYAQTIVYISKGNLSQDAWLEALANHQAKMGAREAGAVKAGDGRRKLA